MLLSGKSITTWKAPVSLKSSRIVLVPVQIALCHCSAGWNSILSLGGRDVWLNTDPGAGLPMSVMSNLKLVALDEPAQDVVVMGPVVVHMGVLLQGVLVGLLHKSYILHAYCTHLVT